MRAHAFGTPPSPRRGTRLRIPHHARSTSSQSGHGESTRGRSHRLAGLRQLLAGAAHWLPRPRCATREGSSIVGQPGVQANRDAVVLSASSSADATFVQVRIRRSSVHTEQRRMLRPVPCEELAPVGVVLSLSAAPNVDHSQSSTRAFTVSNHGDSYDLSPDARGCSHEGCDLHPRCADRCRCAEPRAREGPTAAHRAALWHLWGPTCTRAITATRSPTSPRRWATTASSARATLRWCSGHEFCGEGRTEPDAARSSAPARASSRSRCYAAVRTCTRQGYRWRHPGGGTPSRYSWRKSLSFAVPNGLSAELATLTEPLAVGLHAVRRSEIGKGQVAVVVGCGPVGLAVICMLKARGVRHVIASDFSAGRRALATACGADAVIDPAHDSPFATAGQHGHLTDCTGGVRARRRHDGEAAPDPAH